MADDDRETQLAERERKVAEGEARTKNFSYYLLTVATGDFLGPVLAGFSIDALGHVKTFAIVAVPTLLLGRKKLVWFSALKNSARNCAL